MRQCRECNRSNPDEATFCYFDGIPLEQGAGSAAGGSIDFATLAFPNPFVFPNGTKCHNFLQLAMAFHEHRSDAHQVLEMGFLETFFGSLGRVDLAMSAKTAAQASDKDRALDDILEKLPGSPLSEAKLEAAPLEHNLGVVQAGESRQLTLQLDNKGDRLLYGKVSVGNCSWLGLGDTGTTEKVFQFFETTTIPIQVKGANLRAFEQPQKGELSIESNGGSETVVVELTVPVKPFPEGVLAGATSPRLVAAKAKASPKEAAVLLEQGAVARWYESNGWEYPVKGPVASGIAAVQQFFEVLGLVKTPRVELAEKEINLKGNPGDRLEYTLKLTTPDKRAVVAHGVSDQSWLTVGKTLFRGTSATIPLTIESAPSYDSKAVLDVTANGGQKFKVPIALDVGNNSPAPTPAPVSSPLPAPASENPFDFSNPAASQPTPTVSPITVEPAAVESIVPEPTAVTPEPASAPAPVAAVLPDTPGVAPAPTPVPVGPGDSPMSATDPAARRDRKALIVRLLPIAIILVGLLVALGRDMFFTEPGEEPLPEIDYANPVLDIRFHDHKMPDDGPRDKPTMMFGLGIPDPKDKSKFATKLILDDVGRTCNVVIRAAGAEYFWGRERGQWRVPMLEPLGKDRQGNRLIGAKATWEQPNAPKINVTQIVEIVPGGLSEDGKKRLLDTCLIRYDITNNDDRPHQVGLRFLLDTFIGKNDAVPFTIAGSSELCATKKSFDKPSDVPEFISALERQDLQNPGTVAHLSLKYGAGLEPPNRVTIGAWPAATLRNKPGGATAKMANTGWSVPVLDMGLATSAENPKGDSAVTLYWDDKQLGPKQTRSIGFAYGLGSVTGAKGDGQLALSTGGSLVAQKEFTLTAYVKNPAPGTTITLTTPRRLELVGGSATVPVPAIPPGSASPFSPVTWRVKAVRGGVYRVKVTLNSGAEAVHRVAVEKAELFK